MIITEFYRQRIAKIEKEIRVAELERDFKKVAKLQVEKVEVRKRIGEIEGNL
ncbi:hypothetical protein AB8U03_08480 [Clostridium sp. Mt-5]|uniref:Uncharacterized protein n=1 Tax=Clostridium moutaii TaxID=3240932 RepID=A0ABV4BN65_9CLOT